jgi:RNA polymerase sigma-70 factor (ECF subfamily)
MNPESSKPDTELADAVLIARTQEGNEAACAALVARHLAPVRAFVALRLPIAHVVDEITHETFVFAFTHLAGFELRESFRAWLRSIAFNLVRRELLRFAREQANLSRLEQVQLAELSSDVDRAGLRDEVLFLEECLGRLPESMRRLLDDRYRRGLSGAQIADAWGRTEEWVRVTLLRVRRQLRECIDRKLAEGAHGA